MKNNRVGILVIVLLAVIAGFVGGRYFAPEPGDDEEPMGEPLDGYTLYNPLGGTTSFLIDMEGKVAHTWESDDVGTGVYLLESGKLLRTGRPKQSNYFSAPGSGGRVERLNWNGEVEWEFEYVSEDYCLHHDIEPLPNGNILMISWDRKTRDEVFAAGRAKDLLGADEVWPCALIEVKPEGKSGGKIVWEWHVWDHLVQDLDPDAANYGVVAEHPELADINYVDTPMALSPANLSRLKSIGYVGGGKVPTNDATEIHWTHVNSVDYNEELDQIAISVLGFGEVWIIDHSTTTEEAAGHTGGRYGKGGDILYRWGNPRTYRAGGPEDQKFFGQHDTHWIEKGLPGEGNILVFNNGLSRPDGEYSTVEEFIPPVQPDGSYDLSAGGRFGPEEVVWTYSSPVKTDFYSPYISGAQRLANGNTLICAGVDSYLFEIDKDGNVVWDYEANGGENSGNQGSSKSGKGKGKGMPSGQRVGMLRGGLFRAYRYVPEYPGLGKMDYPAPAAQNGPEQFFKRSDKNKDGKLSEDEVPSEIWSHISLGDKDGDKMITIEELPPRREGGGGAGPGGPGPGGSRDRPGGDRPPGPPGGGNTPMPFESPDKLYERLDKDKDGKLSQEEVPAELWEMIGKGDKDGDGKITVEELPPPPDPGEAGPPATPERGGNAGNRPPGGGEPGGGVGARKRDAESMLSRLDKDGDGKITKEEAPEPFWEIFSSADNDGDGALTRDELKAKIETLPGPGEAAPGRSGPTPPPGPPRGE